MVGVGIPKSASIYDVLKNNVMRCFAVRASGDLLTVAWCSSSLGMVADYTEKFYVWAAVGVTKDLRYR